MSTMPTAVRAPMIVRPAPVKPTLAGLSLKRPAVPARSAATRAPTTAASPMSALRVSSPQDAAEREASRLARHLVSMPAAAPALTTPAAGHTRAAALPATSPSTARFDHLVPGLSSAGSGQPLPRSVQRDMAPRLGADLSAVRVHTGDASAQASRRLNAAAFTLGRDIHFGRNRFQPHSGPGRELLAHELVHTVQQGAARQNPVLQRSLDPGAVNAAPRVRERSAPQVQRLGISDALDWFADKANHVPGFRMLTLLIGFNPISMRRVSRTAANLLRALIELLPGGALITRALDNHGIVDQVAAWAEGQLATLADIGSGIRSAIDDFLDSLSWTDIFDLGGLWSRAVSLVTTPIRQVISFGSQLIGGIVEFVKNAILRPLGRLAEGTRAYPLLKAVLGFDPVTGDPAPRTPATLLGGFMTLIGQDEVWQNIQRGNAVGQAWAWFQGALAGALAYAAQVPTLFMNALRSLELMDIVLVPRAFAKIAGVFASFVGGFMSWALGTVIKLLEIVFSVVAPGAIGYLRRAGGALQSIFHNPIGFVGNLVRAAKGGLQRFAGRFLTHLKTGLITWLTGSLPGVYIPASFALPELLKFGLSVLGLSYANLRAKMVRALGEPAVLAMEMGFDVVRTLVTQGPAAAWDQLKASLANLGSMVVDGIIDMVVNIVVTRAIPRLVAMFIPGAGFITAIMAIWGTIQTFIAQLRRIAQVIGAFVDSIATIAAGNVTAAAARVESVLGGLLSLAINFLAGFAGLGRVADRVRAVLERIRVPIDRALDMLVGWIQRVARVFVGKVKAGAQKVLNWWRKRVAVNADGQRHTLTFDGSSARTARLVLRSAPQLPSVFLATQADRNTALKGVKRTAPIAAAVGHEKSIATLQTQLAAYDDNTSPAVTGKPLKKAEADAADLDVKLGALATHIVVTLKTWKLADDEVKLFPLPRGSFSPQQKAAIAGQHADKSELKLNSRGDLVNMGTRAGRALARRHVVSSFDISQHYSKALAKKKWSEAKLLLEQRGSIALAKTAVVGELSQAAIEAAARQRYQAFFGYAQNLFIGDSAENSSIQEHLDRGNPDLAGKKLEEHVARIKRSWAIDNSIQISGLDK